MFKNFPISWRLSVFKSFPVFISFSKSKFDLESKNFPVSKSFSVFKSFSAFESFSKSEFDLEFKNFPVSDSIRKLFSVQSFPVSKSLLQISKIFQYSKLIENLKVFPSFRIKILLNHSSYFKYQSLPIKNTRKFVHQTFAKYLKIHYSSKLQLQSKANNLPKQSLPSTCLQK